MNADDDRSAYIRGPARKRERAAAQLRAMRARLRRKRRDAERERDKHRFIDPSSRVSHIGTSRRHRETDE